MKPRKVRKGTHSCWECRRRKVRCIFAAPGDAVCVTCRRRSTKCISQVVSDEEALASPSTGQSISPAPRATLTGGIPLDGERDHRTRLDHDEPTRWSRTPLLAAPGSLPTPASVYPSSTAGPGSLADVASALLAALPPRRDLEILSEEMQHITPFTQHGSFRKTKTLNRNPTTDISRRNLLQPDSHPLLLAKQMMRFAIAIQHISPNKVIRGLGRCHHDIMRQLAEPAIKWVTTNDVFLGTLGGIEGIILEALYHIDGGNVRRSWITIRRAITAGQLLGLHQPGHHQLRAIDDDDDIDPEIIWSSAVTMERVLSLLLALPTSTGPCVTAALDALRMPIESRDLTPVLSGITARILDRNQMEVAEKALEVTLEIDRQLATMTENFPSDFWQPFTLTLPEGNSTNREVDVQMLWDQMLYYSLVIQLHLPYMMSPKTKSSRTPSQRVYSRIACANASREVLAREIVVRTMQLTTACSRLGGFLALIAGMTLVLAHAVGHSGDLADNPLAHQRRSDRATVERALLCMESMSELHEDVFAAKCAALLKDLLAIEADAAGHTPLEPTQSNDDRPSAFVTIVPYVGAIKIGRHGPTSLSPLEVELERGPNVGVTIGGIGSMHVESPKVSSYHSAGHVGSDCVASEEPAMRELEGPSAQGNVAQSTQVPAAACPMQQEDQIFPDAAATLDDWVFQGFDTAFFNTLMRDQPRDDSE